jgi:phenylpropionate dioxygenase-like ring-hydroxylating dioxygenase large terminal subunit
LERRWPGGRLAIQNEETPGKWTGRFNSEDGKTFAVEDRHIREKFGLLFVNFHSADGPNVPDGLDSFRHDLESADLNRLVPVDNEPDEIEISTNWKSIVEISLDETHVGSVHPGLGGAMAGCLDYQVSKGVRRWRQPLVFTWTANLKLLAYLTLAGAVSRPIEWTYFWIFPGLELEIYPEQVVYYQVIPAAPNRTYKRSVRLARK